MSFIKLLAGAGIAVGVMTAGVALADDDHGWSKWKAGEVERSKEPHKFGPKCHEAVTSRGSGAVGFGITQFWAKRHTIRNWEEAVAKLDGPEFAKWSKAKDKSVECEKKDKEWQCKARAYPCGK